MSVVRMIYSRSIDIHVHRCMTTTDSVQLAAGSVQERESSMIAHYGMYVLATFILDILMCVTYQLNIYLFMVFDQRLGKLIY